MGILILFINFAVMIRLLIVIVSFLFAASAASAQTVQCEDTCGHIHGIDLSHYQGNVFWEAVSETKMAYVYLKATEGQNTIDDKYKRNIDPTTSIVPWCRRNANWPISWPSAGRKTRISSL